MWILYHGFIEFYNINYTVSDVIEEIYGNLEKYKHNKVKS